MLQTKNTTANLACVVIATVSMLLQDHHVKENQMMMTHHAITNVTRPCISFLITNSSQQNTWHRF